MREIKATTNDDILSAARVRQTRYAALSEAARAEVDRLSERNGQIMRSGTLRETLGNEEWQTNQKRLNELMGLNQEGD